MRALVDAFHAAFFQRALVEAVLVGLLAGAVGAHVLLRRLPFFVVTMSHATFPGVVLASVAGASILLGGAAAGVVVVLLIALLGRERSVGETTVTGIVLAGSFALGVAILSARPGGSRDITAFLVGSILTVTRGDLLVTGLAALVVLAVLAVLHKELVFAAFDPTAAAAQGYRPVVLDVVAMLAVTATMVVAVPAVGTFLAIALLVMPALVARQWTERTVPSMVLGAVVGAVCAVLGLCASALWRIAAGGAITLTAAVALALSLLARTITGRLHVPGSLRSATVG